MNNYGKSRHYDSMAGEEYFAYQNQWGSLSGKLNTWKFAQFIKPSDCVLDFGCGGGWLLRELQANKKYGVEPNPAARNCCARLGVEAFPSTGDLPGDLQFDVIVSHHAIEHVPYPIEALRELRTRLKPSGQLVVVLPIDDWRVQKDYSGTDIDHHLHTWTPRLFANTLAEANLRADKIVILTDAWPPKVDQFCRLPAPIFKAICFVWSVLRRRRQLLAVAVPLPE